MKSVAIVEAMQIHIVPSPAVARAMRRRKRGDIIIVAGDNLLVGPCALDPAEHVEGRIHYWRDLGGRVQYRRMYHRLALALGSNQNLTIWTSDVLEHRVMLWLLCSLLRSHGHFDNVELVKLPTQLAYLATSESFGNGIVRFEPRLTGHYLSSAYPLARSSIRVAASAWETFAAADPRGFHDYCYRFGRKEFGALEVGAYYAGFFPQVVDGRLQLSRIDQLLFACLSIEWSKPSQVFLSSSAAGDALRGWMACTGDLFLAKRLADWCVHSNPLAAVESRDLPHRQGLLRGVEYRLSKHGTQLIKEGLRSVADAPACPIGGAIAYSSVLPLGVVRNDPDGPLWTFERVPR